MGAMRLQRGEWAQGTCAYVTYGMACVCVRARVPPRRWVEQVAQALAYLHEAGVSHGDVSCRNIFFTSPEVHETDVRACGGVGAHARAFAFA